MFQLADFLRRAPAVRSDAIAVEAALRARIARVSVRTRVARIAFDAGPTGAWTVDLDGREARLWRGRSHDAAATITTDAKTLVDVLEGRAAGIEAFLEGRLFLRGSIALALELDDLLPPASRDPRSPRCRTIQALGVRSFYLEAGREDAPPVVLLHGLGATSASFLPTLWDLARDHRVFAVDLPGFGESDKPLRPLHPAFFSRWFVAWLDAVGLERPHLIGNSMGGRVALEVGLRAPSRVDHMVLLAPSMAWRRYRAAAPIVRLMRPELAAMPVRMLHRFVMASIRSMFAHPERVPDAAVRAGADEFIRSFATARGRIAFFHAAREIYLEDPHGTRGFWDRLPALSRPALFIFGEKDRLVPHAFLRQVRRALPTAECQVFEECGHVPQFELPARTNTVIRSFLSAQH